MVLEEIHIGKKIHAAIKDQSEFSQRKLADMFNLSEGGFRHKLTTKYFGTVDELVRISLILKQDFISDHLEILLSGGIEIEAIPNVQEYKQIEEENNILKDEIIFYKKVVNKVL